MSHTPVPAYLKLSPIDSFTAPWRNTPPLEKAAPKPFDEAATVARLTKSYRRNPYSIILQVTSPSLSHEESVFWAKFIATVIRDIHLQPFEKVKIFLENRNTPLDLSDMQKNYGNLKRFSGEAINPFIGLLDLEELLEMLLEGGRFDGFANYINPYLTPEERKRCIAWIRPKLATESLSIGQYTPHPTIYKIAALLGGCGDILQPHLTQLNNPIHKSSDPRIDQYNRSQALPIVFGLDTPQEMLDTMRQINAFPTARKALTALLANTELAATDMIEKGLAFCAREGCKEMMAVLKRIKHPALVETMLGQRDSQHRHMVLESTKWLDKHASSAIEPLTAIAGSEKPTAPYAQKCLRRYARAGHIEAIQTATDSLSAEQQAILNATIFDKLKGRANAFSAENTPPWLVEVLANIPTAKRKVSESWLEPDDLPVIEIDGKVLNPIQVDQLLNGLRETAGKTVGDQPPAFITTFNSHVAISEREKFVWGLLQQWLKNGAPSKSKWAFIACGLLGGDGIALQLAPLIRKWPGESQHQRAVLGLKILEQIGSDTALMQISGIANKVKYQGIKKQANITMQNIAKRLGLSRDQLDDRIVPDCGLDESGRRTYDFGTRQFTFALDHNLKPAVRDEKGKVRANLPKPNKSDNATIAAAALAEWKVMKKQIRDVVKTQVARLQASLISQRRWPIADFERFIVQHPVQGLLAQRLLWGVFGDGAAPVTAFRLTGERDFADEEDDDFDMPESGLIGLVHPSHLSAESLTNWREIFTDYEIVQPFEQLERKTFTLTDAQLQSDQITHYANVKVDHRRMVGILQRSGWSRGVPLDAGVYYEFSKIFESSNVTAVIKFEPGVIISGYDYTEPQTIKSCFFVQGAYAPISYAKHEVKHPLNKVDAVCLSEVLRVLFTITSQPVEA